MHELWESYAKPLSFKCLIIVFLYNFHGLHIIPIRLSISSILNGCFNAPLLKPQPKGQKMKLASIHKAKGYYEADYHLVHSRLLTDHSASWKSYFSEQFLQESS